MQFTQLIASSGNRLCESFSRELFHVPVHSRNISDIKLDRIQQIWKKFLPYIYSTTVNFGLPDTI